jgi:N-acetylglucosaminyl-diphospho-decaprenol L-rhamnosyltransferase
MLAKSYRFLAQVTVFMLINAPQTTLRRSRLPETSFSEIAVIIVNYGTPDLTLAAVESVLARQHGNRKVDIHVVDNASPGGDGAKLVQAIADRGWQDRVTCYPETENHGFGRGNNVVLRQLAARAHPPEYVFFLNPDAQLQTETIAALAEFLDAHPRAAVAGSGIDNPDGTPVTAAFRFPTPVGEFSGAARIGLIDRLLPNHVVPLPPVLPTGRVDWVAGAALLARLSALQQAQFFDPDYFLYYEEVDLMRRLSRMGWEIWHVASVNVMHIAGAATGMQENQSRNNRVPAYWYDSWRMYFTKNHGIWGARGAAAAKVMGWGAAQVAQILRGRDPRKGDHFLADFSRYVLLPLLRPQRLPNR